MGAVSWSVDRPRFFCVVVSAMTGQVYRIADVESFEVEKGDDGSAGTFRLTIPLIRSNSAGDTVPNPAAQAYASAASPMDLVAIYASRQRTASTDVQIGPPLGPGGAARFNWGDDGAATVKALGTTSCLMIGMVDQPKSTYNFEARRFELNIGGRDLTKIFIVNDPNVPDVSQAAAVTGQQPGQPAFYNLAVVVLSQDHSGVKMLTDTLDLCVAKDLTNLTQPGGPLAGKHLTPDQLTFAKQYGFPWRNFIRTDDTIRLNPAYQNLLPGAYPPYTVQVGAVWSSVLELRNPPISRIFVDERGFLVFDDSYKAWLEQDLSGIIGPEDIRVFDAWLDDSDLVTFLSVIPNPTTGQLNAIETSKGVYSTPGVGFANGVMEAASADAAHVQTFGYRYGQFVSMYDLTSEQAATRRKVLLQAHNNIWFATVTVRGDARYRVGRRYQINVQTERAETTNAAWYVENLSHQGSFGDDWTTQLTLRFPAKASP